MNLSYLMFSFSHASLNFGIKLSVNSFGDLPAFFAACAIFFPWSSVPVKKKTSSPWSLCHRARMSAAMVVYACPMCGMSFG